MIFALENKRLLYVLFNMLVNVAVLANMANEYQHCNINSYSTVQLLTLR